MGYRLGVNVGETFADLLPFNDESGAFWRHKTPLAPLDSSKGLGIPLVKIWKNGELQLFDYGPGIEALRADCEAETGLPAPIQPAWQFEEEKMAEAAE